MVLVTQWYCSTSKQTFYVYTGSGAQSGLWCSQKSDIELNQNHPAS